MGLVPNLIRPHQTIKKLWNCGTVILKTSDICKLRFNYVGIKSRTFCSSSNTLEIENTFKKLSDLVASTNVSNITQEAAATSFCQQYSSLNASRKSDILKVLSSTNSDVDQDRINKIGQKMSKFGTSGHGGLVDTNKLYDEAISSLSPPHLQPFIKIGQLKGGVKFLVDMRKDVLEVLKLLDTNSQEYMNLKSMNLILKNLLSNWFSVGFLNLEQVTWHSPCSLVEKICDYEAVHPIVSWTDIKKRVGNYRRCFVYTHPSMPGEPVVILHVALTDGSVSDNVNVLVRSPPENSWRPETEDKKACRGAIFYSVTSTQAGLQGIELGTQLIKHAVIRLQSEFPQMSTFSTLSPIPGFRSWLVLELTSASRGQAQPLTDQEIRILTKHFDDTNTDVSKIVNNNTWIGKSNPLGEQEIEFLGEHFPDANASFYNVLITMIKDNSWIKNPELCSDLKPILMRLCARYLYSEKRRNFALNSVANFHLRNGSCLWRINWMADTSRRGLTYSCGMMVNYRYYLDRLETNSANYLSSYTIDADRQVLDLIHQS